MVPARADAGRGVLRHRLRADVDAATVAAVVGTSADGDAVWLERPGVAGLSARALIAVPSEVRTGGLDLLDAIADDVHARRAPDADVLGWIGWLAYDDGGAGDPVVVLGRVDRAALVEHVSGDVELVALGERWTHELAAWRDDLELRIAEARAHPVPAPSPTVARWADDEAHYRDLVSACLARIAEGDAYQLCLTTRVEVATPDAPLDVWRRLRAASPSPRGGLLRLGGRALASVTPERFAEVSTDGVVTTSPIKGTRPRGATPALDDALAHELVTSEKERAENLMIVDLVRNDLTRVCAPDSVVVTGLLEVERHPRVHQLVSTVQGRLRAGIRGVDAVRSLFPAGSMTGAPKRAAVEILAGLEAGPRGAYAGALGLFALDGAIDLAMTIRTIVLRDGIARIGTGGGITALSDPGEEFAETRLKARPLLEALGAV